MAAGLTDWLGGWEREQDLAQVKGWGGGGVVSCIALNVSVPM